VIFNYSKDQQFLVDAGQIVTKYEMEANVGLRLIHNHFPIEKGQIMVEELQSIKGIASLVTYAQEFEMAQSKKAIPASWIISEKPKEDPIVFEATTDPAVHAGIKLLQQKPEFMNEIGDLLRKNKFTSLLSVALLKKDSLVANDGEMYIEINEASPQKSVVQAWRADQKPTDAIRTSWSFNGPQDGHCLAIGYCQPLFSQHLHLTYHQHM
jgi:hypothetical protein